MAIFKSPQFIQQLIDLFNLPDKPALEEPKNFLIHAKWLFLKYDSKISQKNLLDFLKSISHDCINW